MFYIKFKVVQGKTFWGKHLIWKCMSINVKVILIRLKYEKRKK